MKLQRRWVVWNAEEVKGRKTKVPYSVKGHRASSTDPKDWCTYAEAKKASEFFSGIGIIFGPDQLLLGIDIDHVLVPNAKGIPIIDKSHGEAENIARLIKEAGTYTEVSPSGTGLHLYLALEEPLALDANRHSPYEAYTSGRFFTYSEQVFGTRKAIRLVPKAEALRLLEIAGYPWTKTKSLSTVPEKLLEGSLFTDEELLERMFKAKGGDVARALYEGDASAYLDAKGKPDLSRADAGLIARLAFWTRKDAVQMDRVWLASPLGKRHKTQKRVDYRVRTISAANKNCTEVYRTQEQRVFDETGIEFLFTLNARKEKIISKNTENVARALNGHPEFSIRFDEFKNRIEIGVDGTTRYRPLSDSDAIAVQTRLSILFEFLRTVSKDMVFDAIVKVAKDNRIDSAADYIRSLTWDGTRRLDTWLHETYGTTDDIYHRAVGSNVLKGLVKRIVKPGCKFDYVLVLEGPQGAKKSTSLSILGALPSGDNWHVESTMTPDNKDFFMQFEGKALIEMSEGETLSRTEVKKMKAVITTAVDRYRPSYGRVAEDFPRRCIFAMTTNQEEYLKDETGNRRWLPVRVMLAQANVEWLAINRDQLLAEAYQRVIVEKETTYEFPEEETLAQQSARLVSDPNEERIVEWYHGKEFGPRCREEGITVQEVFVGALGNMPSQSMKKYEEMQIANVLSTVLKLEKIRRMVNGHQTTRWVDPTEAPVPVAAGVWDDLPW